MVSIPIERDLEEAKRVLSNESNAIKQLAKSLGKNYVDAIDKLDNVKGRVIFTGIGKSGHVARKMASTFRKINFYKNKYLKKKFECFKWISFGAF